MKMDSDRSRRSKSRFLNSADLIDTDADMPALADASDCDTSSDDGSKFRSSPNRNKYSKSENLHPVRSKHANKDPCVMSVSSSIAVASTTSSIGSSRKLPTPDLKEDPTYLKLGGCASLFCISEILSWGGKSSSKPSPSSKYCSGVPSSTATTADSGKIDSGTAQRLIEFDIRRHMCCSEGYWRKEDQNLDSPFLCGYDKDSTFERCKKCEGITLPMQQLGNRSACMPEKAKKRIQYLRESGLGRDFSFAPVARYLLEEASIMQNERDGVRTSSLQKGGLGGHRRHSPPIRSSFSMDVSSRQKKLRGMSLLDGHSGAKRSYSQSLCQCEKHSQFSSSPLHGGLVETMASLALSGSPRSVAQDQTMISVPSFDSIQSEIELCYDSDPGIDCSLMDEVNTHESSTGNEENDCDIDVTHGDTSSKSLYYNSISPSLDKQRIEALAGGTYTFIWHPISTSLSGASLSTSPPLWISAWFEMGSCLKTTLIQPKFVWRIIRQPPKGLSRLTRSLKIAMQEPESIELLNIVRILSPSTTSVDRNKYPFVKCESSFVLVTSTKDEYLFEAKDAEQKKRFVFCMKLMIARLASKIIVGDRDVFNEFFVPFGKKLMNLDSSNDDNKDKTRSKCNEEEGGRVGSICTKLVAPVNTEGDRHDELWGHA